MLSSLTLGIAIDRDPWNCPGSLIAAPIRLKLHDERKFGGLLHSIYEAARPSR